MEFELIEGPPTPEGVGEMCSRIEKAVGSIPCKAKRAFERPASVLTWLEARRDANYRRIVLWTLRCCRGEIWIAAHVLGVSESAIYRYLRRARLLDIVASYRRPLEGRSNVGRDTWRRRNRVDAIDGAAD